MEPIDPKDMDWSDAAAMKAVTFRQRPGADNALGFVKFLFPNPFDIYIHDTPADGLFARRGRLFSHGCIRIEDPAALATYVLRDQPEWTRPAIEEAMHAGVERHVKLTRSLPVHVVYFTAWADEQGGVHFREDVYGLDARQSEPAGSTRVGGAGARKAGTPNLRLEPCSSPASVSWRRLQACPGRLWHRLQPGRDLGGPAVKCFRAGHG